MSCAFRDSLLYNSIEKVVLWATVGFLSDWINVTILFWSLTSTTDFSSRIVVLIWQKWHLAWCSAAVALLLQGSICHVFRDALLYIAIEKSPYLGYCCPSISSDYSNHNTINTTKINYSYKEGWIHTFMLITPNFNPNIRMVQVYHSNVTAEIKHQERFLQSSIVHFLWSLENCTSVSCSLLGQK